MTLSEYARAFNDFVEQNPEAAEHEVVTSSDDEGNYYNRVFFTPTIDNFLEDTDERQVCLN